MQLQRLGIDIRKIGSVKNLMSDVDLVLKANGMEHGTVSESVAMESVRHSFHKMMQPGGYFDVCTIRSAEDTLKIHVSSERMAIYRSVHCVHWADMLESFRTTITAMILDDFRTIF